MNDSSPLRPTGRYLDRLFTDRQIFACTHLLLGLIAGVTCVISAIASNRLLPHRAVTAWLGRGAGTIVAVVFFVAVLPYVISYYCNADQVDGRTARVVTFAAIFSLTSLLVDACTVLFVRNDDFVLGLGAIYALQTIAYVWLGDRLVSHDDDSTSY
jgi:ABC-type multidrug transport system permease subunit